MLAYLILLALLALLAYLILLAHLTMLTYLVLHSLLTLFAANLSDLADLNDGLSDCWLIRLLAYLTAGSSDSGLI